MPTLAAAPSVLPKCTPPAPTPSNVQKVASLIPHPHALSLHPPHFKVVIIWRVVPIQALHCMAHIRPRAFSKNLCKNLLQAANTNVTLHHQRVSKKTCFSNAFWQLQFLQMVIGDGVSFSNTYISSFFIVGSFLKILNLTNEIPQQDQFDFLTTAFKINSKCGSAYKVLLARFRNRNELFAHCFLYNIFSDI